MWEREIQAKATSKPRIFIYFLYLECVIYHLHVFKWDQRFSVAEFMDIYLQRPFSEGKGMVGVNLGGKKKDLENSKVGNL